MLKKISFLVIVTVVALFVARFVIGGDEDTWICVDNQWVKHGNPATPPPATGCGSGTTVEAGE